MNPRSFKNALFVGLALLVLRITFCDGQETQKSENKKEEVPAKADEVSKEFRIYVDSVPSGAEVILREKPNGKEKSLGKTPLVANVPKVKSELWVKMSVESLLKSFEEIPGLKEWKDRLKSWDNVTYRPFVTFYRTGWSVITEPDPPDREPGRLDGWLHRRILEAGPIVEIDPSSKNPEISPRKNRECVLFLPVGEKISVLFPIMPPRKTFLLDEEAWRSSLMEEYMFSKEQAIEAVESLSRCGKAFTVVKGPVVFPREKWIEPLSKDEEMTYVITVLPDSNSTIVEWGSRRRLPSTKDLHEEEGQAIYKKSF